MPAVDEILAGLADHPPAAPTPVGEIRGRARRRARRRRALAGAAAAVVLVAVGVGVGVAVADDPGDEVVVDGGTTTAPSSSAAPPSSSVPGPTTADVPVATEPPTMTLDPASGYVDGTVVAMALDEPATGPVLVAQCAAEAEALGDGSTGVLPWCTGPIEMRAEALRPFTLVRSIDTPDGTVDCAEAVGRCTLGIRVGGAASADDRYAPLAFRDDLPALVEPTALVDGDEGTVGDGDTLLVTLAGVETGDEIHVDQCIPAAIEDEVRCSAARSRSIVVQDGPETQLAVTAFHDVLVLPASSGAWAGEWTACEPCELRISTSGRSTPIARLPLAMEPTDDPVRPTLTVDPPGPHAPGEVVTLRATGLQPGVTADVAWCLVLPPEGGGDSPCDDQGLPGSTRVAVGADGTFVLPGYALPSGSVQGEDCSAAPDVCGVGLHEIGWFAYTAIAPLDLGG